ncbi:MAG TPA: signal peptide peptidase SppA, partial [Thermoanaerobaculia bacterium]|nr:signal peptide peptidase SppA [Thermoanaerobaculia bacterium]
MEYRPRSFPVRLLSGFWRGVDESRRFVVNILFLALVVALIVAAFSGKPKVPKGGALVVKPRGDIVEQLSARSVDDLLQNALDEGRRETLLRDLIDAIRAAKDDKRISSIFLDVSEMGGAGMTKLDDLRAALLDFRKSGKKVVAYADGYLQGPYLLAAAADEVWMNPEGGVLLEGFGRWRTYMKDGIDRLGIDWHVFRVGEYKSAVEPFLRNDASPEAKEADLEWLSDLWSSWVANVAADRKLKPEEIRAYIDRIGERLEAVKGDAAKLAVEAKLVDKLGYRDEVRKRMIEIAGEDKAEHTFKQIAVAGYLAAKGGDRSGATGRGDSVAVVVAKGEILDGKQPAGRIGGDSTAALLRKARENEKVKAIVLRVDSPGGSAFASEVIRREMVLARKEGKKVVVSMGSVAASGGYWISTASDEIWASPDTITGSIGIFGMFPTIDRPLAKYLGMHVDGVGTTWLSGALRLDRPLKPEVGRLIQLLIDKGYEDFLARVAEARKIPRDDVNKIARGRVWSGADAKDRKLVDRLGGLPEAIASAAEMAKLPRDARVWYVEKDKTLKERL